MSGGRQRQNKAARRKSSRPDGALPVAPRRRADPPLPDTLDIAVRAYAEHANQRRIKGSKWTPGPPSLWTLVFDTETTTDESQRLRFGTYQIRKGNDPDPAERGIFYVPDDQKALTSSDIDTIKKYAREHKLKLRPVRDFVDNVFYEV